MKHPIRHIVTGSLAVTLALAGFGQAAEPDNLDQVDKDLKIMRNIFETVMQENGENGPLAFRQQPEARYLAGQGMMFTFDMEAMRNLREGQLVTSFAFRQSREMQREMQNVREQAQRAQEQAMRAQQQARGQMQQNEQQLYELNREMVILSEELGERVGRVFPDMDFDFDTDVDVDFDHVGSFSYEPFGGINRVVSRFDPTLSKQQRAMLEEMLTDIRQHEEDVQIQQRSIRDVQREIRQIGGNEKLEEQLDGMEAELDSLLDDLEAKHETYDAFMQELDAQRSARAEAFNTRLTSQIIAGLCDYGATIRSLEDDEHVTLVFENYQEARERIYVFDFSAVASCSSAEALQDSATSYLL